MRAWDALSRLAVGIMEQGPRQIAFLIHADQAPHRETTLHEAQPPAELVDRQAEVSLRALSQSHTRLSSDNRGSSLASAERCSCRINAS